MRLKAWWTKRWNLAFVAAVAAALAVYGSSAQADSRGGGGSGTNIQATSHTIANWVSGSDVTDAAGSYGTIGRAAAGNVPPARQGAVSWIDPSGQLWLFGGYRYAGGGELNDLWKFDGTRWTWISGSNAVNAPGSYGTRGVADAGNVPGARISAVSWMDTSGRLWLFGGQGHDRTGSVGFLNDLWTFDGTRWTWVSGSSTVAAAGSYGTLGVAGAANAPGARGYAVSWTDTSGRLWLFGGQGHDGAGSAGYLNDLWTFDGIAWTWVSGSNTSGAAGSYGQPGVAGAGNVPGARAYAISWIDRGGQLWFFGGFGVDGTGSQGYLNDRWKFDGTQWTWVSGSSTANAAGFHGQLGVAGAGTVPAGRPSAGSWIDSSGRLWLLGGDGWPDAGSLADLADLWRPQP